MKNKKIPLIKQIICKKLIDNKMRNLFITIAVVLTAVLFTTAFSTIFYFKNSVQSVELESKGWIAHGAVRRVTDEQYELMKQSKTIKDISYYVHIGYLEDEDQTTTIEMQYCQDEMASWMYYKLALGHMPEEENEIVVPIQFLEDKGLEFEEGMKLLLNYSVDGNPKSKEFEVCGTYDCLPTSSMVVFVSESFLNNTIDEFNGIEMVDSDFGVKTVEVMFPSTSNLEKKMIAFIEESDTEENDWIINDAYLSVGSIGAKVIVAFITILVLIMLCGYLIIYNIYYISVMQDTRFYGSLVTLGFTEKETKSILSSMTNILCAISIPIGLVIGFIVSMAFLPQILKNHGTDVTNMLPSPLIFVFSALFSYFTVVISSRIPIKMVTKISPIEAKHYTGVKHSKAFDKKKSRNASHLHIMAWKNAMKERKKTIMICCSISLCIILTSLFYSISSSVDMNVFLKEAISCDFIIGDVQYFSKVGGNSKSLDSNIVDTINQWDGIADYGGARVTTSSIYLEDDVYSKFSEIVGVEGVNQEHTMTSNIYGLDNFIFQKTSLLKGKLDLEKFKTGDYIIAGCFVESDGKSSCYEVGDKVRIVFDNGEEKEYTVLAIGDIPYDVSLRQHLVYSIDLYLPSEEWIDKMQNEDYYVYAYDVNDDYENMWNSNLSNPILKNENVSFESKMTYEELLKGYIDAILILGVCVSLILGVIGLLNYINSIYNSIYNRKKELAIMQSMGMTKLQIFKLLVFESGFYFLISLTIGVGVGLILNYFVVTSLATAMDFIVYKINMLPYIIFGISGGLIAICVPILIYYKLDKREDLLVRLRMKV